MTISNNMRRKTFPVEAHEIWVMGLKSRRKRFYLFYRSKGEKYTKTEFEIYIRKLCKKYDYKKFEFLTRDDMYKALRSEMYKQYEDFPVEFFKTTWKQINPEVAELEEKEELFSD